MWNPEVWKPSTDNVREAYRDSWYEQTLRQSDKEFDLWLADVRAEAKREALLEARDVMANHWPLALDEFEAGEVCDWLENRADDLRV